MKTIDNSGMGNCMYYAYSISLMYYLRQQEINIRNNVFEKLHLSENDKKDLSQLLVKDILSPFTHFEIKKIEYILGPACRALAGDYTVEEFLADPGGSSTATASTYGIAHALKLNLPAEYNRLIKLPDARRRRGRPSPAEAFINAEIFKVPSMKNAMDVFSKKMVSSVVDIFEDRKRRYAEDPDNHFSEEIIMEEIVREKSIAFLLDDNHAQMNKYSDHLKRDTVWGSEETLFILHRALKGERKDLNNQWISDNDISLLILENGIVRSWQKPEKSDIILNNQGGAHWVSSIPSKFIVADSKITAVIEFRNQLKKIIKRFDDLTPKASESEAVQFITMLRKKITELDELSRRYSHAGMNKFIISFTGALENAILESSTLNRTYFSEHISNFINASLYLVKWAFAVLISIINPEMLKRHLASSPVTCGLNTDLNKAKTLFGFFQPVNSEQESIVAMTPLTP